MEGSRKFNRRGWLRSSFSMVGAAGVLASGSKSAGAAPSAEENDPGLFNVMAYGAKGDGIADDTDSLQKAIDAAGSYSRGNANKGGVVFLPAGAYQISKTLLINQAVKIFGRGQATIDGATHIVPASLDFDVFKIVGVNWGVVLEGFLIKAYNYKGTGGHFLHIQNCQHVRICGVHLVNCWNGALVDSSGDVNFYDLNVSGADVPGEGRFGIKCTAAANGNANSTQALNCVISQWGKNPRTMDGFVLANGYNSFAAINCGVLNCNRAFWSTKDGGKAPDFFVISGVGCSDHCNTAVALDDGGFSQISGLMVTSSYVDNINIGENITGPVAFSNCVVSTSGGNNPPHGAGYRITSLKAPSVSITGGSVHDTAGHAMDLAGNAVVVATGVVISAIQNGKNADGVRVSGTGDITLNGLAITQVKKVALHVLADFAGNLTFSGMAQHKASRGLFDGGSTGIIVGDGNFRGNSRSDVDVSLNKNAQTCIQSHGAVPYPFHPTPAVPKSGSAVLNATGTNCMVYLSGRNIKSVMLNEMNLGAQSAVYLPVNQSIVIHYTGVLSWVWQRAG